MNTSPDKTHPNSNRVSVQIDASTTEGRRLIVAMELLARAVDKSTTAVLQNLHRTATGQAGPAGKSDADGTPKDFAVSGGLKSRSGGSAWHAAQKKQDARDGHESQVWRKQQQAAAKQRKDAKNLTNYAAYMARRQAGQKLGKYQRSTNYTKKMGSGFSATDRRANRAAAKVGKAAKEGGIGAVLGGLMKLLGPLGVLASLISSNASGFDLLAKGVRLLAAVFAPILLPVAVILAAALLGMSDIIWSRMMPVLKGWFSLILNLGIPALKNFFDAIAFVSEWYVKIANAQVDVYNALIDLVNKIPGIDIGKLDRIADPNEGKVPKWGDGGTEYTEREKTIIAEEEARAGKRAKEIMDELGAEAKKTGKDKLPPDDPQNPFNPKNPNNIAAEAHRRAQAEKERRLVERGVDPNKKKGMGEDQFGRPKMPDPKRLLGEVLASLELSMGPKASITDLGAARSQAQLAALNADPFEARMVAMFAQTIDLLRQVLGEIPDAPPNPVR